MFLLDLRVVSRSFFLLNLLRVMSAHAGLFKAQRRFAKSSWLGLWLSCPFLHDWQSNATSESKVKVLLRSNEYDSTRAFHLKDATYAYKVRSIFCFSAPLLLPPSRTVIAITVKSARSLAGHHGTLFETFQDFLIAL